jgi:PAS domain S-box-containing protein
MATPLRVLIIEDSESDTGMLLRLLSQGGFESVHLRVETAEAMRRALQDQTWDLVLCDYVMPLFDAPAALRILQETNLDLPFIVVSGSIGEDLAVNMMKSGAHDYLLKSQLMRLVPAVQRELNEAQERRTRKQAEAALADHQRKLATLMSNLPGLVYRCKNDPDRTMIFISGAARELTGYDPETFLRQEIKYGQIIHPEDAAGVWESVQKAAGSKSSYHLAYRIRTAAGEVKSVWEKGCGIFDDPGTLVGLEGFVSDTTERLQAVEALRQSELRFRAIFEDAAIGIAVTDLNGRVVKGNSALLEMLDYSEAELSQMTFSEFTYSEDVNIGSKLLQELIQGQREHYQTENRYYRKGGQVVWGRITGSLIRNPQGEPQYVICMIENITGRKEGDQRQQEQTNLLDLAQDAIMVRDLEDRVQFWNQSAERLYGWTATEILNRKAYEVIYRDSAPFHAARKELMEKGEWSGELRHITKIGKEIVVNSRWTLVRDTEGKPKSVLIINTDITQHKELEAQFLRAQRLESIGTLASGIAHDLNNILAPIMMLCPMLREKIKNPKALSLVDTVETNARRGADIVKQILTFSRGLKGEKTLVQCRHLMREISKIAQETFPKSITLELDLPKDLWLIEGDSTQLHQVLMNLCVNARDAMPAGGTLTLAAENIRLDEAYAQTIPHAKAGPYVVWLVADTGVGIPPKIQERIFDPFFTTKEEGKGTGLGLSTVLGIVRSHDGCIRVQSAEGQGTQIRVYLPASNVPEQSVESAPAPLQRGQGELILVVDDEDAVREVLRRILIRSGYRVLAAHNGAEAMTLYQQHSAEIAVVLTDIMMPVLDGRAVIRSLKKLNPKLPIIASSGLMSDTTVQEAKDLGVDAFLRKPHAAETLMATLRSLIDH